VPFRPLPMAFVALRGLADGMRSRTFNSYLKKATRPFNFTGSQRRTIVRRAREIIDGDASVAADSAFAKKYRRQFSRLATEHAGTQNKSSGNVDKSFFQQLRQMVVNKFSGGGGAPKGFGNFEKAKKSGGSGNKGAAGKSGESASKKGKGAEGTTAKKGSKKRTDSRNKKAAGAGGKPDPEDPNLEKMLMNAIPAAVAITAILWFLMPNDAQTRGRQVTWQEFQREYLSRGLVDRIIVYNKEEAVAEIRPDNGDFVSELDSGTSQQQRRQTQGGSRGTRRVTFAIGSVENFERKLEYAQRELRYVEAVAAHWCLPRIC